MNTLVINLFGGSGIGKSTLSAYLFSELKEIGYDCELVTEFAKDLIWENRKETFKDEIYIFAKQNHRMNRLNGKVEVIITDRPLPIINIFNEDNKELCQLCLNTFNTYNNCNIFLERDVEFQQNGRNETYEEAVKNDEKIYRLLKDNDIEFMSFKSTHKHNILYFVIHQIALNNIKGN